MSDPMPTYDEIVQLIRDYVGLSRELQGIVRECREIDVLHAAKAADRATWQNKCTHAYRAITKAIEQRVKES